MSDSAKLQEAHGKMKGILAEHEKHFPPKTLALFRESLSRMEDDATTAKAREVRELRRKVDKMNSKQYAVFISDPKTKALVDSLL